MVENPVTFLVTCPCCRGNKALLISIPCLHCEQTGTVQAEVDDVVTIPVGTDVTERRVRYEPLDLAPPAAAKPRASRSHKSPKRSRPRTRKPVSTSKR